MRVFIIGAAGGVGRRVGVDLVARGDVVFGLHRRPEQIDELLADSITPIAGDITRLTPEELAGLMEGADAVVFSAGAGGKGGSETTTAVDGRGATTTIAAMQLAGVSRLVLVSVFPDAGRGRPPQDGFEHYIRVKKQADVEVVASPLDWVLVRPGTLTDDPGSGFVHLSQAEPYGDVTRDDVAAVIAEILHAPRVSREALELTSGGERTVAQAVAAAVRS